MNHISDQLAEMTDEDIREKRDRLALKDWGATWQFWDEQLRYREAKTLDHDMWCPDPSRADNARTFISGDDLPIHARKARREQRAILWPSERPMPRTEALSALSRHREYPGGAGRGGLARILGLE